MKGCAKFLNFLALIAFLLLLLATLAVCAGTAVLGLKPDLISGDISELVNAITVNGEPVTMEMLTKLRTPILIILGVLILILVLTLATIARVRTALKEISREEPFSLRCSQALNSAAVLVIVNGLVGIALSVYAAYIFDSSFADGETIVNISSNLTFIPIAVFLKMLSGI